MENHSRIRFLVNSIESLNRIIFYLDTNTRPCFEEDVPIQEHAVFNILEFADSPIDLAVDELTLDVLFENIDFDSITPLVNALSLLGVKDCYVFFSDDEEYKAYYKYMNRELKLIYQMGKDRKLDIILYDLDWGIKALAKVISRF